MTMVWDVVCGMQAERTRWSSVSEYEGKQYYFCCDGCKGAFERSPAYHLENFSEEHAGEDPTPTEKDPGA